MPTAPTTRLDPQEVPQLLLGRYRVLEERGHGGFGTVSVCWDPRLMRRVAIKVIPLHPQEEKERAGRGRGKGRRRAAGDAGQGAAGDAGRARGDAAADGGDDGTPRMPESMRRRQADSLMRAALAETRTASMLAHPNIVAMLDFESDDSYAYIIMEYVEGASLAELLDATDDGLLTFDEAAAVAEGVGDALAYAHENGVLHLDIKPDNILVDGSGRVRLADFGMASLSSATGYAGATGGTVGYMPPEQILGGRVDVRTDVFAFAAVMYEALTGTRPFAAPTAQESLDLVCGTLADPCALNEAIPAQAADALLVALDPDPEQRPSSMEAFVSELRMGLGSPRLGRKSLAGMVADVTDDETPEEREGQEGGEGDADEGERYPVDELGVLSRPFPRLFGIALRGLSGVSLGFLAALSATVLVAAGSQADAGTAAGVAPAVVAAGLVVGAIGCVAPQLSAAIALVALVAACLARQLWVLGALVAVAGAAWWALVARRVPLASGACLAGAIGARVASPVPPLLAGILLSPARAAGSAAFSLVVALALAALSGAGMLGTLYVGGFASATPAASGAALALLVKNPDTYLTLAGWACGAALLSALAHNGGFLRCYLGCFVSVAVLGATRVLASSVENGGTLTPPSSGEVAGLATAFILLCAIVFAFGTPRCLRADEMSGVFDVDEASGEDQ
jgi:serine/threonine protein kinase